MTTLLRAPETAPAHAPTPPALHAVERDSDILPRYAGTAVGDLLASHNLGRSLPVTPTTDLLVITCMDHRVTLDIPEFFAFQIRTAGANPTPLLSNVAYAVAVHAVRSICVIGHTDCTMCAVERRRRTMVDGLVLEQAWHPADARDHAIMLEGMFRIDDPAQAAWEHARTLAELFPACLVAPLLYRVEDGALLQVTGPRASSGTHRA